MPYLYIYFYSPVNAIFGLSRANDNVYGLIIIAFLLMCFSFQKIRAIMPNGDLVWQSHQMVNDTCFTIMTIKHALVTL